MPIHSLLGISIQLESDLFIMLKVRFEQSKPMCNCTVPLSLTVVISRGPL